MAILFSGVKNHVREIIFNYRVFVLRGDVSLMFSSFNSGGHFGQWSGTILKILVESHPRNFSIKLF